jgi:predicted RNase H-like HicB family nuclease
MHYTIVLTEEPDGSAFNVSVPVMPGCLKWGATPEEALVHAREAIALHLEGYTERGEPCPIEAAKPRLIDVVIEPVSAAP